MPEFGATYLIVKDFNKSFIFYETFLEKEVDEQNETMWAVFHVSGTCIALYSPSYDSEQLKLGRDIESEYSETYLEEFKNRNYNYGNNIVLNFWTDNLDKEYKRLEDLNIGPLSKLMVLGNELLFHFFTIQDPDGNTIEVTGNRE